VTPSIKSALIAFRLFFLLCQFQHGIYIAEDYYVLPLGSPMRIPVRPPIGMLENSITDMYIVHFLSPLRMSSLWHVRTLSRSEQAPYFQNRVQDTIVALLTGSEVYIHSGIMHRIQLLTIDRTLAELFKIGPTLLKKMISNEEHVLCQFLPP